MAGVSGADISLTVPRRHAGAPAWLFVAVAFIGLVSMASARGSLAQDPEPTDPPLRSLDTAAGGVMVVDEPPTLVELAQPQYPEAARSARMEGWVRMQFVVGVDGTVETGTATVIETTDSIFVVPALRAIYASRFTPGRVRGQPVRVLVEQAVGFRLGGPAGRAGREFGVSFVANVPSQPFGVGFWALFAGGMGGYLDVKIGVPLRDEAPNYVGRFSEQYAKDQLGWVLRRDDPKWVSVNAGLARRLASRLTAYVGGGASIRLLYREYEDSLTADRFWMQDSGGDEYRLNVVGGVLWSVTSRLRLQFGAEMKPPGVVIGIGYVPKR